MTGKNLVVVRLVSVAVAIGVIAMSCGGALAFHRADLIKSFQETVVQLDSMQG